MGLDGYTSEVGITWNIFTVVLLCPTIFKAQKIACHHKPELETSMKYCSCFSWMIASLYMIYKKSSFRFKNFPFFVPSLLVRTLYYVETIPVSFIEVLCHRIHEVSILGLQRNRPSSAKKGWHVEKKSFHHQKPCRILWFGFSCCFFTHKKILWQWPASIVSKWPRMASEKVALQRWTDVPQHFQSRYPVSYQHLDITGQKKTFCKQHAVKSKPEALCFKQTKQRPWKSNPSQFQPFATLWVEVQIEQCRDISARRNPLG